MQISLADFGKTLVVSIPLSFPATKPSILVIDGFVRFEKLRFMQM